MIRITTLNSALLLGLAATGMVQAADTITFDPDGTGPGGTIQVGAFDWTPDNALSLGAVPLVDPGPSIIDIYLQASLGNFLDPNNLPILGTGLNSAFEITFEAGFTEEAFFGETLGVGNNANFLLAAPADQNINFFNLFQDPANDHDPQTGAGYGNGTPILSAVITENATTFFTPYGNDFCTGSCTAATIGMPDGTNDSPNVSVLDQTANGDQQPNVGTSEGSGGGNLDASVTSQNADFFLDPTTQLIVELFFNSSQVTPFLQVDPTGPITCSAGVVGNCPDLTDGTGQLALLYPGFNLINGVLPVDGCDSGSQGPCDFLFQADANQSFTVETPEPSTIALLGMGLAALGVANRRRRQS